MLTYGLHILGILPPLATKPTTSSILNRLLSHTVSLCTEESGVVNTGATLNWIVFCV
jgi:hypothetical protein